VLHGDHSIVSEAERTVEDRVTPVPVGRARWWEALQRYV
jgi:hypothetical protein